MAEQTELKVDSLGRPSFLGQAYNARTGELLNFNLFTADAISAATKTYNAANTVNNYDEVRETRQKAALLNLEASITVSILGGSIDASGAAAYVTRTDSTEEASSISGYRAFITAQHRLKTEDAALQSSLILAPDKMELLGATHVVTAITYGSGMLASLSETNSSRQKNTEFSGQMSIKLFKSFGAFGGAEGKITIASKDRETLKNYELDLRLTGDFLTPKVPINEVALVEMLSGSGDLLRTQVPVHLTLTNLRLFDNVSAEVFYRELEEERLMALIKLYDDLQTLSQKWDFQSGIVRAQGGGLFPTIEQDCDKRAAVAKLMVIEYRGVLGALMRDYRDTSKAIPDAAVTAFTQEEWMPRIAEQEKAYDNHLGAWKDALTVRDYASNRDFPLNRVDKVLAQICENDKPVALVLIPPSSNSTALINLFEGLAAAITRLSGSANPPYLCSIYADPILMPDILRLDGPKQSIALSLQYSTSSGFASILTRGLLDEYPNTVDWRSAQRDGWGVTLSPITGTKYIGNLSDSLPHGQGRAMYSDKRVYDGGWYRGQWDGKGEVTQNGAVLESGIFVDGALEKDGLVLSVTVYDNNVPVDSASMAVVCHDVKKSRPPTIDEMESLIPRQATKIADALKWKVGERYRLRTTWETPQAISRTIREHWDDPSYPPEYVPMRYVTHTSSTAAVVSITPEGAQLEAFEYNEDDVGLKEFGWYLQTNDNIWLDGDVTYQGFRSGDMETLYEIRRNVKELGRIVMLQATRLVTAAM